MTTISIDSLNDDKIEILVTLAKYGACTGAELTHRSKRLAYALAALASSGLIHGVLTTEGVAYYEVDESRKIEILLRYCA
jgi:hypothetical protein